MTYNVFSGTLNLTQQLYSEWTCLFICFDVLRFSAISL